MIIAYQSKHQQQLCCLRADTHWATMPNSTRSKFDTVDRVERTFDIRATKITHFRQKSTELNGSSLPTMSNATSCRILVCRQFVRTSDKVETTSLGIHCRSTLVRHRTSRRQSTFDKTATKARQTRKSTTLSTFVLADGVEFDFVATV